MISCLLALTITLLINFLGSYIAQAYTKDQNVLSIFDETMSFLSFQIYFDCTQAVMGGVIRGIGLQRKAIFSVIFCYYVIGIPLFAILSFTTELKLRGLWLGMGCGAVLINLMFGTLILRCKWVVFT